MTTTIDWESVAVRVFRADGQCYLLSDFERDALLIADQDTPRGPGDQSARAQNAFLVAFADMSILPKDELLRVSGNPTGPVRGKVRCNMCRGVRFVDESDGPVETVVAQHFQSIHSGQSTEDSSLWTFFPVVTPVAEPSESM